MSETGLFAQSPPYRPLEEDLLPICCAAHLEIDATGQRKAERTLSRPNHMYIQSNIGPPDYKTADDENKRRKEEKSLVVVVRLCCRRQHRRASHVANTRVHERHCAIRWAAVSYVSVWHMVARMDT